MPATFEQMMEHMMRGLLRKICIVYLDNVIVYGRTQSEALDNLRQMLDHLRDYGLKLKPKECCLFQRQVEYLRRIVSEEGVRVDYEKIRAVQEWPIPVNARQVRQFLGFASHFKRAEATNVRMELQMFISFC